jgi:hypothetical protein
MLGTFSPIAGKHVIDQQQLHEQRHAAEKADENLGRRDKEPSFSKEACRKEGWRSQSRSGSTRR